MGPLCLLQSEHALVVSQCDLHTDGAGTLMGPGTWGLCQPQKSVSFLDELTDTRWTLCFILKNLLAITTIRFLKAKQKIKNYFNSTHVTFQNTFPQLSAGLYSSNSLFCILVTFQSMEIKEGLAHRWHCKTTMSRCCIFTLMVLKLDQTEALTEMNQTSCTTDFQMLVYSQCF